MHETVDITIEPNDKYLRVIGTYSDPGAVEADDEGWEDWPDEHKEAGDDYAELVDEAAEVDPEDYGVDPDEIPTVSWSDISPSSDSDIIAKIATYFDGMEPDEPTDLLRAKCRLLDVEVYIDVQMAAQAELRGAA